MTAYMAPESIIRDLQEGLMKIADKWSESPVIVLPKDETRKQQLRDKIMEYAGRMHPYRAPELQMDTICKIAVLERLLNDSRVNTWELSHEMANTYGSGFDANAFNRACGVIEDYCKTGGENLHGGTGLRAPEQMNSMRLRPGYPPMGKRVRLIRDHQVGNPFDLQPGDKLVINDEKLEVHRDEPRRQNPIIAAGSVGIVEEGPYCSGIFDYTRECPVQFEVNDPMIPKTLGIPWELLEFAE